MDKHKKVEIARTRMLDTIYAHTEGEAAHEIVDAIIKYNAAAFMLFHNNDDNN